MALFTDEGMLAKLLPVKPDLETAETVYPTWRIEKWNELEQKKHLPNFECGGSLWCVLQINIQLYCQQVLILAQANSPLSLWK